MSAVPSDKLLKQRQLVLVYLSNTKLSERLNKSVNELCRTRPADPWLFLQDALSDLQREAPFLDRVRHPLTAHCPALPISCHMPNLCAQVVALPAVAGSGQPCVQLLLFGRTAKARPPRLLARVDAPSEHSEVHPLPSMCRRN